MANRITWDDALTAAAYLSTELNALSDGSNKLGGEIDNSVTLDTRVAVDIFLDTQAGARDAGAHVAVYLLPTVDGTNFAYGSDSLDPSADNLVATVAFNATAVAQRNSELIIEAPPSKFKLLFIFKTGQALAATGNVITYSLYTPEVQ